MHEKKSLSPRLTIIIFDPFQEILFKGVNEVLLKGVNEVTSTDHEKTYLSPHGNTLINI